MKNIRLFLSLMSCSLAFCGILVTASNAAQEQRIEKSAQQIQIEQRLFEAICTGKVDVAKSIILENKSTITAVNDTGSTPLHIASFYGYLDIVDILLENGADIKATNNFGCTALHYTAQKGHTQIARRLIEEAKTRRISDCWFLDVESKSGKNALHFAAEYGQEEVVKILIEAGIRQYVRDRTNRLPLHYACLRGNPEIVRYMLSKITCGLFDSNDRGHALYYIVRSGSATPENRLAILDMLMRERLSPNIHDENGNTPLHLATKLGKEVVSKLLHIPGIDISARLLARNKEGKTPLDYAIQASDLETALLLHDAQTLQIMHKQRDLFDVEQKGRSSVIAQECREYTSEFARLALDCKTATEQEERREHAVLIGEYKILQEEQRERFAIARENLDGMPVLRLACMMLNRAGRAEIKHEEKCERGALARIFQQESMPLKFSQKEKAERLAEEARENAHRLLICNHLYTILDHADRAVIAHEEEHEFRDMAHQFEQGCIIAAFLREEREERSAIARKETEEYRYKAWDGLAPLVRMLRQQLEPLERQFMTFDRLIENERVGRQCGLCLDDKDPLTPENSFRLKPCGHNNWHVTCIGKWIEARKDSAECPLCCTKIVL